MKPDSNLVEEIDSEGPDEQATGDEHPGIGEAIDDLRQVLEVRGEAVNHGRQLQDEEVCR